MHARFYAPGLEPGTGLIQLPREEAEHLARVLRLRVGDEVQVFSGLGYECRGWVETIDRGEVGVRVGPAVEPAAEPRVPVVLAQAVLKGDGMDDVVRDAVMVGVAAVVPLFSARTEADAKRLRASNRVARWQRIAIASAKQSGRAVVPVVHDPQSLDECLGAFSADQRLILTEPTLPLVAPVGLRGLAQRPIPTSVVLFIGPEGGWTLDEVERAVSAGCLPLTLGPRTLRANAAPLVGLSALQCLWGDLN